MPAFAVGFFGEKDHPISFLSPEGAWTVFCAKAAVFTDRGAAEQHAMQFYMPSFIRAKVKVQQVAP
jgi:hypothetical protein